MKSDAVKQLVLELWQQDVGLHPALREHAEQTPFGVEAYISKPKRSDTNANGLTQCIMEFIRLRGGQAERISVMGRPVEEKGNGGRVVGVRWTKSHMTIGTADISATIRGRSVKIEVKIGKDRQSDEQRKYQAEVERAGGLYYIARDFAGFVEWYNKMFGRAIQ